MTLARNEGVDNLQMRPRSLYRVIHMICEELALDLYRFFVLVARGDLTEVE